MPIYIVSIKLVVKELEPQDSIGIPCKVNHEVEFADHGRDLLELMNQQIAKQADWLTRNIQRDPPEPGSSKLLTMPGFSREKEKKVE